jgi:CxxC motif-containing protein (DUF1111 family)
MKGLKLTIVAIFVVAIAFSLVYKRTAQSQVKDNTQLLSRQERFKHNGVVDPENSVSTGLANASQNFGGPSEAPVGFDNRTNGFDPQGAAFDTIDEENVVPLRSMNDNRFIFEEVEGIVDGLGPTYNAQSCRECHQNVVTGGASQIAEHRTGRTADGVFFESLGGSLIQSRATHQNIVERVFFEDNVSTFRISTNTLGNGFLEAVANSTIQEIRDRQPASMRGIILTVPVLEASGNGRFGRFGWKNQHASLESFSADAYLNEMGITTPGTFEEENLSSGRFVGFGSGFDPVPDPEDDGIDVIAFANFMRSTKAPSRGPINSTVTAGDRLFREIGCATCHVPNITTAPAGTLINGGAMRVRPALGNKIIHPYTDLLLHDIGTGDGIPFLPTPEFAFTAPLIRTAPLWALRTRNRLMHDGLSFTLQEAILRHQGQAASVTNRYNELTQAQKDQVIAFLNSL